MLSLKTLAVTVALIALAMLSGCGQGAASAPALNAGGEHPANWYTEHRSAFLVESAGVTPEKSQCARCHGADYQGGISQVGCFQASRHGLGCHSHPAGWGRPEGHGSAVKATSSPLNGTGLASCQACHGTKLTGGVLAKTSCYGCHATAPHAALPWRASAGSARDHTLADASNAAACATCHLAGRNLSPAAQLPSYNTAAPGCFNSTLCHGAAHSSSYPGHAAAARSELNQCRACHGTNLTGAAGPSCLNCHQTQPVADASTGCNSCHGAPPSGSSFPNSAGAHARHNAISGITGACNTCHYGFGSGTLGHYQRSARVPVTAQISIDPTFTAQSGTPSFVARQDNPSDGVCLNVSCHGGVQTPPWFSGRINSTSDCLLCHQNGYSGLPPQYNSYQSGLHRFHLDSVGMACYDCHDNDLLRAGHFGSLATQSLEQPPAATIRTSIGYNGVSCLPRPAAGTLTVAVCHDARSWR